jgi:hypothetical protein
MERKKNNTLKKIQINILEGKFTILIMYGGLVYEDDLGWRLRHNKDLCELLDGPDSEIYFSSKDYNGLVI